MVDSSHLVNSIKIRIEKCFDPNVRKERIQYRNEDWHKTPEELTGGAFRQLDVYSPTLKDDLDKICKPLEVIELIDEEIKKEESEEKVKLWNTVKEYIKTIQEGKKTS